MLGQARYNKMRTRLLIVFFLMSTFLNSEENFGIVVHGGAGVMSGLSEETRSQINAKIKESVSEAFLILENGGSSIDAVEKAVTILEDSPLFNAGRALFIVQTSQEMDASIMDEEKTQGCCFSFCS